jgi:5-methylcytosine-specific restriction endonuclease McrA
MRCCWKCKGELPADRKSDICAPCKKAYRREYYATNRDHILDGQRRHYARNASAIIGRVSTRYYGKRESISIANSHFYQLNKDKLRARIQDWRQRNPEEVIAIGRVSSVHRNARKKGADGSHTIHDIQSLMKEQLARCAWCPTDISREYHVDHAKPLKAGGSNRSHNLQLLCPPCNRRKGASTMQEFALREYKYNPMYQGAM